ncbi:MAG: hydroxyacid dehydrogenase [Victivallaceae bacterium]|nr:hydroxyacid dehydrogenase [Victivallaceae bacterium]
MTCYRSILLCENQDNPHYVYNEAQMREIENLANMRPEIVSAGNLTEDDFSNVEMVFSTWGMPCLTEDQLDALPNLKIVFYAAGATDAFAKPLLRRGIRLVSAWRANAIPVAEFCVSQIILALKGYFGNTRELTSPAHWNQTNCGPGVYGDTVALIGAGAIATLIAGMLGRHRINVITVPSRAERRTISLEEAFSKAFVISNHLPDRDDNAGVLNGALFRSMRKNATFINTGRGRQVNEAELIKTLEDRPDLTALLDVTYPEPPEAGSKLYTLPNVHLSAHIAGSMHDEVHRMADYVIADLKHYLSGEKLDNEITAEMLMTH